MTASLVLAPVLALLLSPQQEPEVAIIQLPADTRVTATMRVDLDGDGHADLVLACRDENKPTSKRRSLRTYLRQPTGPAFVTRPSAEPLALDQDVIAFAFCDCLPAAGPELILVTDERFVLAVRMADGTTDYRELARHALVWPAADEEEVVPLPRAPVDFDGDGLVDLVLPTPDGWSVCFQDRVDGEPRFERRAERMLPPWQNQFTKAMRGAAGDSSLELRFGDGPPVPGGRGSDRGPLVVLSARTPRCQIVDLDADAMLDLVAHRNGRMFAARQAPRGRLTPQERDLPLPPDRLTLIDPAFDVQFADVDGDARADLVLTTSTRRDDDIESRVDLYRTRPDSSWPANPDQRLRLQALAGPPRLIDVDGDGRRDLVCLSLRTASMRDFTGTEASSLDAQLSMFHNDGQQFVQPALLTRPLPLAAGESRLSQPFLLVRAGTAGRPGDVVLHIDGGIERRALEQSDERLRLGQPTARIAMPAAEQVAGEQPLQARIEVLGDDDENTDADEFLILTRSEVRHVRFPR